MPREVSRSANSSPENTRFEPRKVDPTQTKAAISAPPTRAKAEKHERAVQYFKRRRWSHTDVKRRPNWSTDHCCSGTIRHHPASLTAKSAVAARHDLHLGHSTLPIERFTALLQTYAIERVADVRTIPRSRHNPQFNADALGPALKADSIEYVTLPALGGLRHSSKGSFNKDWRNESFRGYADYMADRGLRGRPEKTHRNGPGKTHRPYVRGSGAVALSSLSGGRLAHRSRHPGHRNSV